MKKSKHGKVNAENLSGKRVPRKGLTDQTKGKSLGTGNVRRTGGPARASGTRGR